MYHVNTRVVIEACRKRAVAQSPENDVMFAPVYIDHQRTEINPAMSIAIGTDTNRINPLCDRLTMHKTSVAALNTNAMPRRAF
jgi:hypothetical protein